MKYLVYDGSFEGLFTVYYECLALKLNPDKILPREKVQPEFFVTWEFIAANKTKAGKLIQRLKSSSYSVLSNILFALTADEKNIEIELLEYIQLALKHGKKADQILTNNSLSKVLDLAKSAKFELHRLKGLIRFRELENGIFYAPLEPDNNIVPLFNRHFSARLPNQTWIIHDLKRNTALFYNNKISKVINITENLPPELLPLSTREKNYQILWQTFYKNIAVKERKNSRLKRQYMPQRYWKYLIEKPV